MIQTLAALAEPNRLAIVEFLRDGPRSVTDIVDRLGLSQPLVSKHLKVLSDVADRAPARRRQATHLRSRAGAVRRARSLARHVRRAVGQRLDRLQAHMDRSEAGGMSGLLVSKDIRDREIVLERELQRNGRGGLAQLDHGGRASRHGGGPRAGPRRSAHWTCDPEVCGISAWVPAVRAARGLDPVDLQRSHLRVGALLRRRVLRRDRRGPRPGVPRRDRRVLRRRNRPHAARAAHHDSHPSSDWSRSPRWAWSRAGPAASTDSTTC